MSEHDEAPARVAWPALLPWQPDIVRAALERRDAWPHALLIHGRAGIGKHVLALHFAQALLCESPRPDGLACGACASCGYVAAGQHPDLRLIEPRESDEDGTVRPLPDIPIAHIRSLIEFTQVTSHRRRAKVALISPAERMNASAANALLKTLEEPPPATFLMLVAHQPGRLPATVRSRCLAFAVPAPSSSSAISWLARQAVPNAEEVLAQAGGSPLSALALADPLLQQERNAWLSALARPETMSPLALGARIEGAGRDDRKDRLAAAIGWLVAWTADLARVAAGGDARRNPDFGAALSSLARRVASVALLRYHRGLLRQRALIQHPLQPRLVVEALLYDYRSLFR